MFSKSLTSRALPAEPLHLETISYMVVPSPSQLENPKRDASIELEAFLAGRILIDQIRKLKWMMEDNATSTEEFWVLIFFTYEQ